MGSRLIARLRMLLVDTNIIAPLYVRSARSPAVAELFARDPVWRTEPLALIELSNVLITYERARYITTARARDCLNRAAAFTLSRTGAAAPYAAGDGRCKAAGRRARLDSVLGRSARHSLGACLNRWKSMNLSSFFAELKRRNVYKVAVAYAIVGWLLVQVATQVFPFFEIPNWAVRLIVLM
ncbi:MAG: hypothetical protein DMF26_10525, partial [Verrucomicrobia bacterium]